MAKSNLSGAEIFNWDRGSLEYVFASDFIHFVIAREDKAWRSHGLITHCSPITPFSTKIQLVVEEILRREFIYFERVFCVIKGSYAELNVPRFFLYNEYLQLVYFGKHDSYSKLLKHFCVLGHFTLWALKKGFHLAPCCSIHLIIGYIKRFYVEHKLSSMDEFWYYFQQRADNALSLECIGMLTEENLKCLQTFKILLVETPEEMSEIETDSETVNAKASETHGAVENLNRDAPESEGATKHLDGEAPEKEETNENLREEAKAEDDLKSVDAVLPKAEDDLKSVDAVLPKAEDDLKAVDAVLPKAEDDLKDIEAVVPKAGDDLKDVEAVVPKAGGDLKDVEAVVPKAGGDLKAVEAVVPKAKDNLKTAASVAPKGGDRLKASVPNVKASATKHLNPTASGKSKPASSRNQKKA